MDSHLPDEYIADLIADVTSAPPSAAPTPSAAPAPSAAPTPSAAPAASASSAALAPPGTLHVFEFSCGYGGPQACRVPLSEGEAAQLVSGSNPIGSKPRLVRKARTAVAGVDYVLVVFGVRGAATPDEGVLSSAEFRKVLGRYRGGAAQNNECYVVRLGSDGAPASFERQNPFLTTFFPHVH